MLASDGFDSGVRSSSDVGRSSMAAADASIMATEGESVHVSDLHVSDWMCMCAFAQKGANLRTVWVGVNKIASENDSTYRAVSFCTNILTATKFARYTRVRCE